MDKINEEPMDPLEIMSLASSLDWYLINARGSPTIYLIARVLNEKNTIQNE
jgi:hypothetical protein